MPEAIDPRSRFSRRNKPGLNDILKTERRSNRPEHKSHQLGNDRQQNTLSKG